MPLPAEISQSPGASLFYATAVIAKLKFNVQRITLD